MQTIVGLAKIQNKCQNRIPAANTSLLLFCRLCFHLLQMLGLCTNWCLCWRWTQGESHTASLEDRPSPPGGGPPLPGVTRTTTVGKAPKSPLAACVWSIQGGIWSVSSAPFMGSKWIQQAKKKKKLHEASFLLCLRFQVVAPFMGPCWFSHEDISASMLSVRWGM